MREAFLTELFRGQAGTGDAIVVLAGEDAQPRADFALNMLKARYAETCVLTGGRHDGVRWIGAQALYEQMIGSGVSPSKFLHETLAMNTKEQAQAIASFAAQFGWHTLLLVASPYHLPRAFLTFIAAMPESVRVVPYACIQVNGHDCPVGMTDTRNALCVVEWQKIEEYSARGDCATVEDGLAYLARFT